MNSSTIVVLVLTLTACGGSGGSDTASTDPDGPGSDDSLRGIRIPGHEDDTASLDHAGDGGAPDGAAANGNDDDPLSGGSGQGGSGSGEAGAGSGGGRAGAGAGASGAASGAGASGSAAGSAGSESGSGGTAGGEAGSAGGPSDPHEQFLGTWDEHYGTDPADECDMSSVEQATFGCSASGCYQVSVSDDFEIFADAPGIEGTIKFDHWEGETWISKPWSRTYFDSMLMAHPYTVTFSFWLADEDTMFGYGQPDAAGVSYGIVTCAKYKLTRVP